MRNKARVALLAAVTVGALTLSGCASLGGLIPGLFGGDRSQAESAKPKELPARPAGTVQGMGEQEPNWRDCGDGLTCADVYAPLDWTDPAGELITLRLIKHKANGNKPLGTLFVNPGGPGASGVDYLRNSLDYTIPVEVQAAYDVVAWDPRGVGASTPVRCLDTAGMDEYLFGAGEDNDLKRGSDEWIAAAEAESREFGEACEKQSGELIAHVSTNDTVADLDMLRAIVGDEQLNYLGFSYGTYIGARYADAYPEKVGRLVLDGAMDPSVGMGEVVREQTRGFELALRAYVTDCLTRSDCPFGGTVDEALGEISAQLDAVDAQPLEGRDGRVVTANTLLTAIITPLYSQANWGYLDQLFSSVNEGDAKVALALADMYHDRENGKYLSNSTEAFSAINCLDYPAAGLDPARMRAEAEELKEIAPTIGRFQGFGDLGCAGWPVEATGDRGPVTAAGAAPILVIGTTGDPATPYRWAEALASQLESGVLLTYEGEGHTAYGDSSCIGEVVDAFLLDGDVPTGPVTCRS